LQYNKINWDSAFALNIEGIINARNKNEYAVVVQKMLSALNDNLTRVVGSNLKDMQPLSYNIKDSIL
jgi:hypothetical protein